MSKMLNIPLGSGDGWTPWHGGPCPVHDQSVVEVRYRRTADPSKGIRIEWPVPAGRLDWRHDGADDDIVAYRLPETEDASV